jgi:hypothetical protein
MIVTGTGVVIVVVVNDGLAVVLVHVVVGAWVVRLEGVGGNVVVLVLSSGIAVPLPLATL